MNVIPVIAKADSFTSEELFKMKLDIIITAIDRGVKFFDCDKAIDSVAKNVSFLIFHQSLTLAGGSKSAERVVFKPQNQWTA